MVNDPPALPTFETLNAKREKAGIDVGELATAAGLSRTSLWRWARSTTPPRPTSLERLSAALDALIEKRKTDLKEL